MSVETFEAYEAEKQRIQRIVDASLPETLPLLTALLRSCDGISQAAREVIDDWYQQEGHRSVR